MKIAIIDPLKRYDSGLSGFVQIYGINQNKQKKLISKSNLIVYTGREWLLTSIFKTDNTNLQLVNGHNNWGIYYLSVGDCNPSDPQNPPPPTNTDTALINELTMNSNDTENYADKGKKKPITITFTSDINNDDKYLIAQTSTVLNYNDVGQGSTVAINEAALWISNNSTPANANNFVMFSRVTFPTIQKDSNLSLEILWYIYS